MKLEEAIKWNEDRIIRVGLFACKEELDAMKLGIEALKRVGDCRQVSCDFAPEPLPGETEE